LRPRIVPCASGGPSGLAVLVVWGAESCMAGLVVEGRACPGMAMSAGRGAIVPCLVGVGQARTNIPGIAVMAVSAIEQDWTVVGWPSWTAMMEVMPDRPA